MVIHNPENVSFRDCQRHFAQIVDDVCNMSLFNLETVCINFGDTWEKCPDIDLKSVQEREVEYKSLWGRLNICWK